MSTILSRQTSPPLEAARSDHRTGTVGVLHFQPISGVLQSGSGAVQSSSGASKVAVEPEMAELEAITELEAVTDLAVEQIGQHLRLDESILSAASGTLVIGFRDVDPVRVSARLREFALVLIGDARSEEALLGRVEIGLGWCLFDGPLGEEIAVETALKAAQQSVTRGDLHALPIADDRPERHRPAREKPQVSRQLFWCLLLSIPVPVLILVAALELGYDISSYLYWALVGAVIVTVVAQVAETLSAVRPPKPKGDGSNAPKATAIIAAYLPNEAATILETVDRFLSLRYAGELEIILAYNTPRELPVEAELKRRAAADPRLHLLKVQGSTSKAQNVNAAISIVTGEFVGIFDADHLPMTTAFDRAWRWLGGDADIVQGHCVVRNGKDGALQSMVAIEFEMIYAVSHSGRQRVHGFGIFGGSNGFWRTSVLREIRMRADRLTEDIDASMRALIAGYKCVNDRRLISRELAPASFVGWWNQRLRWSQGWLEVSLAHSRNILRRNGLSLQQRVGLSFLLVWREIFYWVTPLIWSLMLFTIWRDGGLSFQPGAVFWLTIGILSWGPVQLLIAFAVGDKQVRGRFWWWPLYAVANLLFYQELKNLVGRVAQIKHLMGERQWIVTPRATSVVLPVPHLDIGTSVPATGAA